ncbi:MAG TPA: dihydrolipoyl dehydrogenase [Candidatus Methanomethylicus sp.]|nr:dihydrolipoyl dehydrogenase [Candidatus Methanomethylicus sp.]
MELYDLIVIGSGSGLDVAVAASNFGKKVAIIEKGALGGTCLNKGCIPSKMLIHSADVAESIKRAELFGIKTSGFAVNFDSLVKRVTDEVDGESARIEAALQHSSNPVLYKGQCRFTAPRTVEVAGQTLAAEKVLIAAGSCPNIPQIKGLAGAGFMTSDDALRLNRQPASLAILGGGYIAAELAHFYGSLGTKVTIVQRGGLLIPSEDEEVSQHFTHIMGEKYRVYTRSEAVEVSRSNGVYSVTIENTQTRARSVINSDALLVAVGRVPNSDLLDLQNAGVRVDSRGYIITDDYLETTSPGTFALGDIIGRFPFKHAANHESDYALQNILAPEQKMAVDYYAMPHAIFASPQIAGVGKTERQLKEEGARYVVAKWNYIDSGMGLAIEDRTGFVKFLLDPTSLVILGCHIMGTDAASIIHEVIVAMRCGHGSIMNILGAIHIHPALPEVIRRAASNFRALQHEHNGESHEHEHEHEHEPAHQHEHTHDGGGTAPDPNTP